MIQTRIKINSDDTGKHVMPIDDKMEKVEKKGLQQNFLSGIQRKNIFVRCDHILDDLDGISCITVPHASTRA